MFNSGCPQDFGTKTKSINKQSLVNDFGFVKIFAYFEHDPLVNKLVSSKLV